MTVHSARRRLERRSWPLILLYWVPLAAYAVLIFYLSGQSHPERYAPLLFEGLGDKVLHAMEYGVFGVLCYRALRHAAGQWVTQYALSLAIVAAGLYGVSDELHQSFVPSREADAWDLVTDIAGAAAGIYLWSMLAGERGGRNRDPEPHADGSARRRMKRHQA